MTDVITLTIPSDEGFDRIAHLVLGGLAVRLDVTLEHLEDLQLALDALLACRHDGGEVSVVVRIVDEAVYAAVGPFADEAIEQLRQGADELGLRRVLQTVCDGFEVGERSGGTWVELTKRIPRAA